ncbi:MAG: flagellar hook assembly protein FlgD [Magnetospirillum sp.]
MSITGIESTGSSSTGSAVSSTKLAENFDTFLTMLTVQLKNQDPLSPMDSTEFTNQLVQFSAVEQQIASNKNLENLISVTQTNTKAQAIAYIGHTIEVGGTMVPVQDGKAAFSYTLPEEARSIAVVIKDTSGAVVANLPGNTTAGRHEVEWDGRDTDGNVVEDGPYYLSVVATNGEGETMEVGSTVYGRVTDVAADSTETLIAMGKVVSKVEDVLTVRERTTSTAAN